LRRLLTLAVMLFACSAGSAALLVARAAYAGPVLPPPQFDHAFAGQLYVIENQSQDELRWRCNLPGAKVILGCAHVPRSHGLNAQTCYVYLAPPDIVKRMGQTMDQLYRHERAHCVGWLHPVDPASPEALEDERISQQRLAEERAAQTAQTLPLPPFALLGHNLDRIFHGR
jgi:hypothetical protein